MSSGTANFCDVTVKATISSIENIQLVQKFEITQILFFTRKCLKKSNILKRLVIMYNLSKFGGAVF